MWPDIAIYAVVGGTFTTLALLKFYGLRCGMVGGRDKPLGQYVCGTCPTWTGRRRWLRWAMPALFLVIGVTDLILAARMLFIR